MRNDPKNPRVALAVALLLASPALAGAEPPAAPTPEELRANGWTALPAGARLDEGWEVRSPTMPLLEGANRLLHRPATLPRPTAVRGESQVRLPLAAHRRLVARDDSGPEPRLAWTTAVSARDAGAGVLVAEIDLLPHRDRATMLGAPPPSRGLRLGPGGLEGSPAVPEAPHRAHPVHVRPDPTRRFVQPSEPLPGAGLAAPTAPVVVVEPQEEDVWKDALLVTRDGGQTWLRVALESAPEAHLLGPGQVFAAEWRSRPTLFVAPTPRQPDAAPELVGVDFETLETSGLGRPVPRAADWSQEVTDLRTGAGGSLEVLVLVHDPILKLRRTGRAVDSWGAHLRLDAEGRWSEVSRLALPGDARHLRLRFDPAGTGAVLLEHEGRLLARRGSDPS